MSVDVSFEIFNTCVFFINFATNFATRLGMDANCCLVQSLICRLHSGWLILDQVLKLVVHHTKLLEKMNNTSLFVQNIVCVLDN